MPAPRSVGEWMFFDEAVDSLSARVLINHAVRARCDEPRAACRRAAMSRSWTRSG